jgi:hypothetical protein
MVKIVKYIVCRMPIKMIGNLASLPINSNFLPIVDRPLFRLFELALLYLYRTLITALTQC